MTVHDWSVLFFVLGVVLAILTLVIIELMGHGLYPPTDWH